jgi:putative hemolysin
MFNFQKNMTTLDFSTPNQEKKLKNRKFKAFKKLIKKKLVQKLFGKGFAAWPNIGRHLENSSFKDTTPVKPKKINLQVSWATSHAEIKEAQKLRFAVFADEMGAKLPNPEQGLDIDAFDDYCEHLLVRDRDTLKVVGTYRVLPPHQAQAIGRLYSDAEFDLSRLNHLRPTMVELGRSCVHEDYRSGAVIMALWGGLAEYMTLNGYETMLGCASITMADGGHYAASLYRSLKTDQLAPIELQAFPKLPLPIESLQSHLDVKPPPLIKGYLKLGAKICSAPAWDPDFNTADLLTMLRLSDMNTRYAKHFFKHD